MQNKGTLVFTSPDLSGGFNERKKVKKKLKKKKGTEVFHIRTRNNRAKITRLLVLHKSSGTETAPIYKGEISPEVAVGTELSFVTLPQYHCSNSRD